MSKESKGLKIKYFNCQKGKDHEGQALNFVCIDSKCNHRGLLCSICKSQNHNQHNVVPLKILLQKLKHHQQQPMQSQYFQDHIGSIETIKNQILYELRLCVENIADKFRDLQRQIIDDFGKVKVELLQQIQLNMKFEAIIKSALNSVLENQQAFSEDMARIASLVESTDLKKNITFQINLTKIVENYSQCRKGVRAMLDKSQSSMDTILNPNTIKLEKFKSIKQQKTQLTDMSSQQSNAQTVSTNQKYTFSSKHKGNSIKLDKNNKAAKQGASSSQRFVFVNEGIGMKEQKIAFRVTQLKNWVGLGVGVRDNIQKQKYHFNCNCELTSDSNLGHGSYLVSSNGFTWSHTEKSDNIISKNFNFKQGDIVQVYLKETTIQFKKRTNPSTSSLSIKLAFKPNQWPHVGFCVNLCSVEDAIEIVD